MDDMTEKPCGTKNFGRVLKYLLRHRMRIVLFFFSSFGVSAFMSLPLFLIKMFLGTVLEGKDIWLLYQLAGLILISWVFLGYFSARREVATQYLAARSATDLVNDVAAALLRRPLAYFGNVKSGDLISRIMTDAGSAGSAVFLWLELVREPLTVAAIVSAIFYLNWKLALIGFIGFPIVVYPLTIFGRRISRASRKVRELNAELTDSMVQLFSGMKMVKAYQLEDVAVRDFWNTNNNLFHQSMTQWRANAMSHPVVAVVNGAAVAAVIVVGGAMVVAGSISPEDLLTFVASFGALYRPVKTVGNAYNQLRYMTPGLDRLFEILDARTGPVSEAMSGSAEPAPLRKNIVLENVTFSYGRETVLESLNAEIAAGCITAVAGPTGAGKTTVIDLLAGFYAPTEGRILWDGRDMREFDRQKFLHLLSYVPQQPVLFNVSIRDNILMGRPGASQAEVEEVCRLAEVHEDIARFKNGYDTLAGEAGGGLSGGQKQRIALARALLRKDASLFIFDEPTGSLDVGTEDRLWHEVRKHLAGKTVLLVAHRLTLVRHADRIIVLNGRRVEATGTHEELLEKSPTYSSLWRLHGTG